MNRLRTTSKSAIHLDLRRTISFSVQILLVAACARNEAGPGGSLRAGAETVETRSEHDGPGSAENRHEYEETGALHLDGVRGVTFAPIGEPREEGAWFAAEAVADARAETVISALVSGQVAALFVDPGTRVAKGARVLELRSPELADLGAAYLAAEARAKRARRDFERERKLADAGATSAREVEAAEAEAVIAETDLRAAVVALEGRGVAPGTATGTLVVRAPRAGTLARVDVALGESVESGRRLATIVSSGAAFAKVELALPGPQRWPTGSETEARSSDGRRWRATVAGTPPALSSDTRRLAYRLRLDQGELPLAGTPLEVRVPLARALVLPQAAMQQVEGTWGVFVRIEEGGEERAEFRPVTKGAELGSDVMVLAGVESGEYVATEGAYLLKALWLKRAGGGDSHDH